MSVNIADYMTKIMQDQERKKAEQDRLLNNIKSSQAMSQATRPAANLIDFLSGINPRQKGTKLAETIPGEIDEQRLNAALTGYTIPDNKEMLALIKIAQEGNTSGNYKANERLRAQGMYDAMIKDDIKSIENAENGLVSLRSYLASPNIQTMGVFLSQFARAIAGEKGVLTDKDITRIMPENLAKKFSTWDQFWTTNAKEIENKGSLPKEYFTIYKKLLDEVEQKKTEVFTKRIQEKTDIAKLSPIGDVLGYDTLDKQAKERLKPYITAQKKKDESLAIIDNLLGDD